MIRQCAILVGGLGTRLGPLTRATPKPLLPVGGRPFLDLLLEEAARHGFTRVVLLAGHLGGQVAERYAGVRRIAGRDVAIAVAVEPQPAGTGGALRYLADVAEDAFLLMNGDSWFDVDLRAFAAPPLPAGALVRMALRRAPDAGRYGAVRREGGRVRAFSPRGAAAMPGEVNAGIYVMRRAVIESIGVPPCSLEADVLPPLAAAGGIEGVPLDGAFVDIGVPEDYAAAGATIARRRRPAVFLDRDGTLNHDEGYTHRPEALRWLPGAREAVRRINRAGLFAFVVSNQSGVARGYYDLDQVDRFHARMDEDLAAIGAHVDEFRCSPYHPEAAIEAYRRESPCRKPRPGMILDLAAAWPIDLSRSLLVGDRESDLAAAAAAGIRGHLYAGGDLDALMARLLPADRRDRPPGPAGDGPCGSPAPAVPIGLPGLADGKPTAAAAGGTLRTGWRSGRPAAQPPRRGT
jgi:D-glycero-D-manno-heptose 1,7-bisphosphate phosphatase